MAFDWARPAVSRLVRGLPAVVRPGVRYPVITNALGGDASRRKRALLVYVVKAFAMAADDARLFAHQNARQCRQIAGILDRLGYRVDVVDVRDSAFVPRVSYDLVVSNRADGPEWHVDGHPTSIFLASVLNHRLHNGNLRRRHEALHRRRRRRVEVRRVYSEWMPCLGRASAIAGFGNEITAGSWREVFDGPVYPFDNYGFADVVVDLDAKNFETARTKFLYFASATQVQKGLDLLLEIFPKHPNLELSVCGYFEHEPDFCACYYRELYRTPNIHALGFVPVGSAQFERLVRTCAAVIHPTCSDGQPGSVVQCMHAGLIPIVTREAGIDTKDFGLTIPGDAIGQVEDVILQAAAMPADVCRQRSTRTRSEAVSRYGEDPFRERWTDILSLVLGAERPAEAAAEAFEIGPAAMQAVR